MVQFREFLVDVDNGTALYKVEIELRGSIVTEEDLDDAYELVEGMLQEKGIEYTYFNLLDVTYVEELKI